VTALPAAFRVLLLIAAAPQPQDSVVYELSPASRFEVKTGKAGLLGFAGHTHLIRARAVSGRIVYFPHAPAASRVEVVVPAESLEVLTPPDTAEIRKVTQAMRTEVLHVEQYRDVRFISETVTADSDAFQVRGALTLAGQTRDVVVAVKVRIAAGTDTLRAAGTFAVKQTDFGIKPYRGGPGGTVRVADRVTFVFEAVGVARPAPRP
jgi:polyisoprenoid-binding protein YceI